MVIRRCRQFLENEELASRIEDLRASNERILAYCPAKLGNHSVYSLLGCGVHRTELEPGDAPHRQPHAGTRHSNLSHQEEPLRSGSHIRSPGLPLRSVLPRRSVLQPVDPIR